MLCSAHTESVRSCRTPLRPLVCLFPARQWFRLLPHLGCGRTSRWAPPPRPQPLAPSASPARGPPLVFGGPCFDLSFLPRHLPSQESPCAAPSSATQRSAFETLPCRTDHSHNTARFCKGSLSSLRSSRQPGPVPTNTAPGPGPCWLPALLPSAAFEAAWGAHGSRTAKARAALRRRFGPSALQACFSQRGL